MAKKTKNPPTPFSVWVVDIHYHTVVPIIELYTATKCGPTGAKVLRCGFETFIRAAMHRHFFTDESKMQACVKSHLEHELKRYEHTAARIREVLGDIGGKLEISKVLAERPAWYDKAPILD